MDIKLEFSVLKNKIRKHLDKPKKSEQELSDENGKYVQ